MSAAHISPLVPYERFKRPLLAYVCNRLVVADHRRGKEIARRTWALALGSLQVATETGMEEDIPAWLAAAARRAIREYLFAAAAADDLSPRSNVSLPTAA